MGIKMDLVFMNIMMEQYMKVNGNLIKNVVKEF